MKTPFKKLRGFGLHRHNTRRSPAQLDELSQASQDMHDMKDCYDSLLSAAAATANSAYEFSESLREMGDCLLEKTALNDDEDSGRVLLMLGKVQFEIQKQVDNYRAHISRTITAPSESLLSELRVVEDMKRQCDEKRMTYDEMKIRHKEKRKTAASVKEHVSSGQLRAAQEAFDEDATLFVFRMKSLKSGQSRSLLTQAARHHAAQMCFFRKALKSLEAIEPQVKLVTEQQYIDYHFSGLEDDDRSSVFLTDDEDTSEDDQDEQQEDGELSFEYQRGDPKNEEVSSSDNSMELDCAADITFPQVAPLNAVKVNMQQRKPLWNPSTLSVELNAGSKSAPLTYNMDRNEKFRQMRNSSARKLNTYVLPTPLENQKKQAPTTTTTTTTTNNNNNNNNLWHSSPLEKASSKLPSSNTPSAAVLKESNINSISKPTPLPSPTQIDPNSLFSAKKIKRYAFSGPIQSNKSPLSMSGPIPIGAPFGSTTTTKLSSLSGSFVSSPKISELHELPRPPAAAAAANSMKKVGFSAPLVSSFKSEGMVSPSPPRTPVSLRNT